jgi:succinyl-diaminopimelate desuccinylase
VIPANPEEADSSAECQRLLAPWLVDRREEMRALIEELVAVPTENPPGRELGHCARILERSLDGLGLEPRVVALDGQDGQEDPAVVIARAGDADPLVNFHGHFDVVPAQSRSQFHPTYRDGRVWGRGSADMKGGLAAMIYAAAGLRSLGLLDRGRVVLHLVCDEETGSTTGSGNLRREGSIDPSARAMLTPEPTGGVVWHANRGAITIRVTVSGREAHVGLAHRGDNAFARLLPIATELQRLSDRLAERRTSLALGDESGRGSMTVVGGQAGSGANFNVVPGSAWLTVDRRFNPEEDLDEEVALLRTTVEEAARRSDTDVRVEVLQRQPAAQTPVDGAMALALGRCVEAVEGSAPRYELCPGVLETRWYAQLGVPAFAYGPGRLEVSHGPDEFVELAAVERCALVYGAFALAALA